MSQRTHFLCGDPQQAIDRARALADDLARIAAGDGPTADDLAAAPILDCWALGAVQQPALFGAVVGHPRLGDRPLIHTSVLFAVDGDGMFARTLRDSEPGT
jgi:hypothetical protein